MNAATFTKSGNKASVAAKLDTSVFGLEVKNHDLLKQTYDAYLANGRTNLAYVKTRGEVRGGGRKPWKQKGTGRARFGSSRVPIWRGGGITFGPTGLENYSKKTPTAAKRVALRQALSLQQKDGKVAVIETFECKEGKTRPTVDLLAKLGAKGNILLVVSTKDELVLRATRNIQNLKVAQASYLNVYDLLNADMIIVSQKSLEIIHTWLKTTAKSVPAAAAKKTEAKV